MCRHYFDVMLFVGATAVRGSLFGKTDGFFYIRGLYCSGSESRLVDCDHSPVFYYDTGRCGDGTYAGVKCIGKCSSIIIITLYQIYAVFIVV